MMKKLAVFLLLISGMASSQGSRFDSQALGAKGPLANVTITVCSATAVGIPCSPTVQTFTDVTLGTACSSGLPVTLPGSAACQATSDSLGNYGFWLSPGAYRYSLSGPGITGKLYDLTVAQAGGGAGVFSSLLVSGNVTETAGQNIYTSYSINNNLNVDGNKFANIAACLTAAVSGQYCHLPPGYSETSTGLTFTKNNTGIICDGSCSVNQSGSITITAGVTGIVIMGQAVLGGNGSGGSLTAPSANFAYTGTGTFFTAGSSVTPTSALRVENISVDLTGAGNAAVAMDLINVHGGFTVKNVFFVGKGGAVTQSGLLLDDAGGCSGACGTWDGVIEHNWFTALQTGIGCNGNIQEIAFIQNIFFAGATSGTAFNVNCSGGGNGSYIFGNTVSSFTTAYNFTANATAGWELHINGNSNTTDIAFASGSSNNNIYWDNSQTGPIISDSSGATSNNHVYVAGYNGLLNEQPAAGAITGTGADATYYTYTLPARALPPGKCLDIEAWANHSTGTASTVYKVFFGSTLYVNNTSTGSGQVYFRVHVCNNAGSITAQHGSSFVVVPTSTITTLTFGGLTSSESGASAIVIKTTFNVAATDQLTPEDFVVRMSN